MANWRLAESLKKLREEINEAFPRRSKASDGSIGDIAHSARASDHNPNDAGVVTAVDLTHDVVSGCTGDRLAAALIKSRDPRIKYLIWNKRMIRSYPANGKPAWAWQPYKGVNAHQHHLHISVSTEKALYDLRDDWDLDFDIAVTHPELRAAAVDDDAIQHSGADEPIAQPSIKGEQTITEAGNASNSQASAQDGALQTNESGAAATQVVVQPNALTAAELPIVPADAKAVDVETVEPTKTGAKKSLWATIIAGVGYLALNVQAFFTNAYETVKGNPVLAVGLVIGCVTILVVYWKYQERQTKLDEQREKQAFELTKLQMELAANQTKYSVNLVKSK